MSSVGTFNCRSTLNRVFSAIDPHAFLACFVQWVQGICPNLSDEVVAIDGKALRRALNDGDSIPYIVSAWATQSGLVLGQVKVDEKSNEITAVPELLDALVLKGCIVTLDAMGCQKEIAATIIDKQAHLRPGIADHMLFHAENVILVPRPLWRRVCAAGDPVLTILGTVRESHAGGGDGNRDVLSLELWNVRRIARIPIPKPNAEEDVDLMHVRVGGDSSSGNLKDGVLRPLASRIKNTLAAVVAPKCR